MTKNLNDSFEIARAWKAHIEHVCWFETCPYCNAGLKKQIELEEQSKDEHENNLGIG